MYVSGADTYILCWWLLTKVGCPYHCFYFQAFSHSCGQTPASPSRAQHSSKSNPISAWHKMLPPGPALTGGSCRLPHSLLRYLLRASLSNWAARGVWLSGQFQRFRSTAKRERASTNRTTADVQQKIRVRLVMVSRQFTACIASSAVVQLIAPDDAQP